MTIFYFQFWLRNGNWNANSFCSVLNYPLPGQNIGSYGRYPRHFPMQPLLKKQWNIEHLLQLIIFFIHIFLIVPLAETEQRIMFDHWILSNCETNVPQFIPWSRRSKVFFKMGVVKNFANFTEKHLCWSLSFKNSFFYRTPPVAPSADSAILQGFSASCLWPYQLKQRFYEYKK